MNFFDFTPPNGIEIGRNFWYFIVTWLSLTFLTIGIYILVVDAKKHNVEKTKSRSTLRSASAPTDSTAGNEKKKNRRKQIIASCHQIIGKLRSKLNPSAYTRTHTHTHTQRPTSSTLGVLPSATMDSTSTAVADAYVDPEKMV